MSVTVSQIRSRVPAITSDVASDQLLTDLITEATDANNKIIPTTLPTGQYDLATIFYVAHEALQISAMSSVSGSIGGPQSLQSASFVDRSVSLSGSTVKFTASGPSAAYFGSTVPGLRYLSIMAQSFNPMISSP